MSRLYAGLMLALVGYFFATSIAIGPQTDHAPDTNQIFASLSYSGTDPVITGSVSNIFQSSGFVGPNRLEKTNRQRPRIDVLHMAQTFTEARIRLAALSIGPYDPSLLQSRIGDQGVDPNTSSNGPNMSVAVIDPALASAALVAINSLDPSIPRPMQLSSQLAYSRAQEPATERAAYRFSERERWCLSTAIYFEARGESYRGQVAVAQVIMNRVDHSVYPNSICGVVFQNQTWRNRCQFSFACDGISERINDSTSWAQAEDITAKVTNGVLYLTEVGNATHYHANYVYPHWAPRMTRLTRVGAHIFYRFRRG